MNPHENSLLPREPIGSAVGCRASRLIPYPHTWAVYILRAVDNTAARAFETCTPTFYTGMSTDPLRRLLEHNAGKCRATKRHQWYLLCGIHDMDADAARMMEIWLKTGDTTIKRNHLFTYCTRNQIDFATWIHYRNNLDATMGFVAWQTRTLPRIKARAYARTQRREKP